MIYTHTVERALRYYPQHTALASGEKRSTFQELHERVGWHRRGAGQSRFRARRSAGHSSAKRARVYRVDLRLQPAGSDRGPVEHAAIAHGNRPRTRRCEPARTNPALVAARSRVRLSWELVLDKEPLDVANESDPDAIYDPEAILALVYTSGTTGHPKGVARDTRQRSGERPLSQLLDAV